MNWMGKICTRWRRTISFEWWKEISKNTLPKKFPLKQNRLKLLLQCDHMKLGIADRLLSILAKMNKISAQPHYICLYYQRSARIVFLQLSKILSPYYKKGFYNMNKKYNHCIFMLELNNMFKQSQVQWDYIIYRVPLLISFNKITSAWNWRDLTGVANEWQVIYLYFT